MPSETERITNEFMDRHAFAELAERRGGVKLPRPEILPRDGDDLHFLNKGYMELERPFRDKFQ